jgi:DNA-binding transcriptional MerR regulator
VGYTAIQAARLSGCTSPQLEAWRRIGLLVPDDSEPGGPYSFRDLVALRMVASLLDAGLPMSRIRRAVAELVRTGDDITGLRLVTDGESVWACHDDGQILDALGHGQLALFVAVDRFADEVEHEVRDFDDDRRAFVAELRDRPPVGGPDDHPSRGIAT